MNFYNNLSEYKKYKYTVIKDVINKNDINVVKKFLFKRINQNLKLIDPKLNDKNLIKKYQKIKKKLSFEKISILSGQFDFKTRLSPKIIKLATNKKLITILNLVTQTKVQNMHLPPMARFIIPGNKKSVVPPHKDKSYNKHLSEFFTVWIPLTKINKLSGGLRMYNSKAQKKNKVIKTKKKNSIWLPPINIKKAKFKDLVPLNIGDIVIFKKDISHGSIPNKSKKIRLSLDFRFFSNSSTSNKMFLNIEKYRKKKQKVSILKN